MNYILGSFIRLEGLDLCSVRVLCPRGGAFDFLGLWFF